MEYGKIIITYDCVIISYDYLPHTSISMTSGHSVNALFTVHYDGQTEQSVQLNLCSLLYFEPLSTKIGPHKPKWPRKGVHRVLEILRSEFDTTMALVGERDVEHVGPHILESIPQDWLPSSPQSSSRPDDREVNSNHTACY